MASKVGVNTRAGQVVSAGLPAMELACRRASRHILIATPFMNYDVAAYLARAAQAGTARTRRLIIAGNESAVRGGYLDPDGVKVLADSGFEVRSLLNLHAKTVLADGKYGIAGSGNLTASGSNNGNAELGVILTPQQVGQAEKLFSEWWRAATALDLTWLDSLKPVGRKGRRPTRGDGRGGIWRAAAPIDLRGNSDAQKVSGYWLKMVYGGSKLLANQWGGPSWVSDRHTFRADGTPKRRPSYKVGDHLVIYVTQVDRPACPAILRVTVEPTFDPALVKAQGNPGDEGRWSWVTHVEPIAAIDLDDAPTLAEILVPPASVRQQGHIHLSQAQYLAARDEIAAAGGRSFP